jgi:hypothetical protein
MREAIFASRGRAVHRKQFDERGNPVHARIIAANLSATSYSQHLHVGDMVMTHS